MKVAPGEPAVERWTVEPISEFVVALRAGRPNVSGRPCVIAINGRSAGGKSTLAERLANAVPGAAVVHTDDVAWHESFFGWSALLVEGVLRPAWTGGAVRFWPPAWEARGRDGAIVVPAGCPLLVVEGVGASRKNLVPWIDHAVWVQSDIREAERRGIIRDGDTPEACAFWDEWMAEEIPFLADDRPWERAEVIVCGTPTLAHDPEIEVVVFRPLREERVSGHGSPD
ncbi:MAG: hypothetical protein QM753_04335 [Thermomicrobiales bacterium]